jgi:hypothetical protein
MDLHVTQFVGATAPRNITIENNVFDRVGDGGFYAVLTGAWENLLIRNNSAAQPIQVFGDQGPAVNTRLVANVAPLGQWQCDTRIVYRYNVWEGARCGATDRNAPTGFIDPANLDLRLRVGAAAINRGDPQSFPRTDITGRLRPLGKRPDAGAFELR